MVSKQIKRVIGFSCNFHDSAVALIENGEIISAVQEERFTRVKNDSSFPIHSFIYCLNNSGLKLDDIDQIIYYEKPFLTFERLLETYLATAPFGIRSFIASMQIWLKEKLFFKYEIKRQLLSINKKLQNKGDLNRLPDILFSQHHLSHAAAAFYPSPFDEAVILCMDGVGEWATTSAWIGKGKSIIPLWEINFPHSLGLLYSSFTYYCGFKVNSGEYKLMGLAPYGEPIFADLIKDKIIDIKEDGSFNLDMSYFKYHRGFRMTSKKFHDLFGNLPRKQESKISQFYKNVAASIQKVLEEIVILIVRSLKKETGIKNLCLGGGVALNCVVNGKIRDQQIFENYWIQPAAGDAGNAIGAGLLAYYSNNENKRFIFKEDSMKGSLLGPEFSNKYIKDYLTKIDAKFHQKKDIDIFEIIANELANGKVIGWFSGRMEFGPRALGCRSIIGDPRNKNMQRIMNLKIKFRESFRPFAPSILEEELSNYFETDKESPYMLFVSKVKNNKNKENSIENHNLELLKNSLPAVTHVDNTARVQSVNKLMNKRFYKLIETFFKKTGCPIVINTSFNVRGEPIVCYPSDAFKCFMRTDIDILILENNILFKDEQINNINYKNFNEKLTLD